MTDDLILKREPREVHPAGQFPVVCLDLIDMGMRVSDFNGKETSAHSCVFIFGTGEKSSKGMEFYIPYECNITFGEKSKLLKFLTQWRGKPFQAQELSEGFKLSSLVGKQALVSLSVRTSKSGNDYAVIETIMPLPKGMTPPVLGGYTRAPFWAEKKLEYKMAYDKFLGRSAGGSQSSSAPDEILNEVPF